MLTIPALKIQQFAQSFYMLNLAAADVDRLVRFEVLGDAGLQGKTKRRASTSAINWSEVESRVQTSEKAFQRPILRKKVEELAAYYLQCREDGALPAIPGAVILVSDAPDIEFSPQGGNPFIGLLQLPEEEGTLRVLDGQHRLLALAALLHDPAIAEHGRGLARQIQVPAILFAGLPPPSVVEMFVTINRTHTRLNPSLLVSLSGRKLYSDPKEALAHDVIRALNETEQSPLHGQIKMLGVGTGKVQQSSLAQELKQMLLELERRSPELHGNLAANAPRFFLAYFTAVADVFGSAWASRKHSLRAAIALRAFIQAVPEILVRAEKTGEKMKPALRRVLAPWGERVGADRFETAGAWRAKVAGGGKETTRLLAKELIAALGS